MDNNRVIAFLILRDVADKNSYADITAGSYIRKANSSSPAFVRDLAYGVIRQRYYLDYIISGLLDLPIEKTGVPELILLRMGIYQILFMDSVPDYAAANETVELSKKFAKGRSGFINGVLRQFLRNKEVSLPDREKDLTKYLSIVYSWEPWIIDGWIEEFGVEKTEQLLVASNTVPPVTLRVNPLKTSTEDLYRRLTLRGFSVRFSKNFPNTLHVRGGEIIGNPLYEAGLFSIQDEASLTAALMLSARPGQLVIDVCAAPGGKTMAIAESMNNQGKIIAMDVYKRKLSYITEQADRLGITIVETRSRDAVRADESLLQKADRVLADVPCSGLGIARHKPDVKYKKWDAEMESLPDKQMKILTASSKYLKPGGIMVYSTCTIGKRENRKVVSAFLRAHPEFKEIESVVLTPDKDGMDGFYVSKMQKSSSIFVK